MFLFAHWKLSHATNNNMSIHLFIWNSLILLAIFSPWTLRLITRKKIQTCSSKPSAGNGINFQLLSVNIMHRSKISVWFLSFWLQKQTLYAASTYMSNNGLPNTSISTLTQWVAQYIHPHSHTMGSPIHPSPLSHNGLPNTSIPTLTQWVAQYIYPHSHKWVAQYIHPHCHTMGCAIHPSPLSHNGLPNTSITTLTQWVAQYIHPHYHKWVAQYIHPHSHTMGCPIHPSLLSHNGLRNTSIPTLAPPLYIFWFSLREHLTTISNI